MKKYPAAVFAVLAVFNTRFVTGAETMIGDPPIFLAQAAPPVLTPREEAAANSARLAAKRGSLEALLKSGDKEKIKQAFAAYKDWFNKNQWEAENSFWYARPLIMPMADHATDTLEIIDLAREYKLEKNPANVGYLYILQAESLYLLNRDDEAKAAVVEGFKSDPIPASREVIATVANVLARPKKYKETTEILTMAIAACSDDPNIVERCLQQRIAAYNALKQFPEALADAKSLFNVSTMGHTAAAIALLDRQFLLPNMEDRATVEKFRQEQTDGAALPIAGEAPKTSPTLLAIKVDAKPLADALAQMTDDTFKELTHHVTLLLVADRANDALEIAKKLLAQAADDKEIAAANELIARCYKAQDGTIGRANAWVGSNLRAP